MALPSSITKKLLKATSDKTALNHRVLRLSRAFKEAEKALGGGNKKAAEKKSEKKEEKNNFTA